MGKILIDKVFQQKISEKQNLFIPYIMAGDGGLNILEDRIKFLEDCGVSAIELGIPFSDPVADGPTIQEAGQRALANGTTLKSVLQTLEGFKEKRNVPIILMTYINPIYRYGLENFATTCEDSGVDGVIIPDIPLEEESMIAEVLSTHNIAFIRLAALTSPKARINEIAKRSEGFLYAVSVTGTTGVRSSYQKEVYDYLKRLKEIATVPVLAGFGVSSSTQAQELSNYCDGVIVGSKLVDLLHEGRDEEVKALIQESL